jgi:hypothetical protein
VERGEAVEGVVDAARRAIFEGELAAVRIGQGGAALDAARAVGAGVADLRGAGIDRAGVS